MRYNLEKIEKMFLDQGYILLTKVYVNNKQKLKYISPKGYIGYITLDRWLRGQRHPKENKCYYDLDKVRNILMREGFELLNRVYEGSKYKVYYKCEKCGTINSVVWNQWKIKKNRCKGCVKLNKLTSFRTKVSKENYVYVNGDYYNNRSVIDLICPNGHMYTTNRFNWVTNKSRCPKCNCFGESVPEKQIIGLLKKVGLNYLYKNRDIIKPYELDIVLSDKKIAIEYCGLYWHSELAGKDKNYHLNKLNMCNEQGYQLLTIFEDEWVNKREIVESRLLNILGSSELKTIYARKCVIKEITPTEARVFCEQNHLQGYTGSRIKLGAYYNEDLVSVMTFAKPSISKGANPNEVGAWELSRFCSKINFRVIGIASKLLKHFERNYNWNIIFSYADRRWSNGNVYEKLGFDLVGITKPNYWYFNDTDLKYKRVHRFVFRKKPGEPKNITEWELRKAQGYYRIWDCGSYKYARFGVH